MTTIKLVTEHSELEGIKKLQQENLKTLLSEEEAVKEGFVTAEYTLEFLEKMHLEKPSVIAKDGEDILGYALASVNAIRDDHALLADLFNIIDKTPYKGRLLKDSRYVVIGQLCVAKNYRGLGLVKQMYLHFKKLYSSEFDYCITDVAKDNPRSLKAHLKSGFTIIKELQYDGVVFDLVLWDWNTGSE
jgi:hypothetical protein